MKETRWSVAFIPWNEVTDRAGSLRVPESNQRGREEAFSLFVLPELEVLARVASSLTRNVVDAEDLVQETLLSAFQAIDRFDGAHPRAWLLTIMRNAEAKRHRRRRPALLREQPDSRGVDDPGRVADSAEQTVIGRQFEGVVAECLQVLPHRHRQVIEMVDISGLSYSEAAAAIGVPVGTVMSRLHRGRARIRQRLAAAGLGPHRGLL